MNLIAEWALRAREARPNQTSGSGVFAPGSAEKPHRIRIDNDYRSAVSDERIVRNPHRLKSEVSPAVFATVDTMAEYLKIQARESGVDQLRRMAKGFLRKVRLLDEQERLPISEMVAIGDKIVPVEFNIDKVDELIDRMAMAMTENEFVVRFLEKANRKHDWKDLRNQVTECGAEELSGFIAYAIVLQRLTETMFRDL